MMDCGLDVARQCGVPLESAMISDVPGYTWGTAVAMAHAGVKYFSFGPNWFGRMGCTMAAWQDKPFYWETPDGRHRVLCWCPRMGYALGATRRRRELAGYLPGYLAERAEEGYPYDDHLLALERERRQRLARREHRRRGQAMERRARLGRS